MPVQNEFSQEELQRAADNLTNLQVKNTGIVTNTGQEIPVAAITPEQLWRAKYGILLANVTDVAVLNNTIVLVDAAAKISHYNEIPFDSVIQQILAIVREDSVHKRIRRKK